ncbi:MAG: hypothetical protein IH934_05860 [Nanoarchaeota archaeon]|nr:hypothetical protein [Nanoarchaeota archaeon]
MGGFRALLIPPIADWWNSVVKKNARFSFTGMTRGNVADVGVIIKK